ncbi:MAG: hypothetical protein ACKN9V_05650, partial [Pseudomonadota bacterium]
EELLLSLSLPLSVFEAVFDSVLEELLLLLPLSVLEAVLEDGFETGLLFELVDGVETGEGEDFPVPIDTFALQAERAKLMSATRKAWDS